jgi:hypothetical protein
MARNETEGEDMPADPLSHSSDNRSRVEYAKRIIEELAINAIQAGCQGSIGVEIPVRDGKLGKVKQTRIVSLRE